MVHSLSAGWTDAGHRNIQGLVVHPETGDIWLTDHGSPGGDELTLIEAGKNHGWPDVTLGLDYRTQEEFPHSEARLKEGMVDPVYELLPTLAPSGLADNTRKLIFRWCFQCEDVEQFPVHDFSPWIVRIRGEFTVHVKTVSVVTRLGPKSPAPSSIELI